MTIRDKNKLEIKRKCALKYIQNGEMHLKLNEFKNKKIMNKTKMRNTGLIPE